MSRIDEQIAELQLKKRKLDYLEYIKDLLKGDQKCVDFLEVQEEVLSQVIPLLDQVSKDIEDFQNVEDRKSESGNFSADEARVLKILASKAQKMESRPTNSNKAFNDSPQKPAGGYQDKMNFALDNRHLANRKVTVRNDRGNQTRGVVVGLDSPYVLVKSEAGPTLPVLLENLELEA